MAGVCVEETGFRREAGHCLSFEESAGCEDAERPEVRSRAEPGNECKKVSPLLELLRDWRDFFDCSVFNNFILFHRNLSKQFWVNRLLVQRTKRRRLMQKRNYMRLMVSIALMLTVVLVSIEGRACTGIQIKTEDGHFIFARTLEFSAEQMPFNLIVVPRNHPYRARTPSGKPGMAWKTKYAYVGFNPFGAPLVADGLNERGLACGSFLFPGCAKFEALTGDKQSHAISSFDLTSWILSTCASVSEVRQKLPKIVVFAIKMPELGPVMDLHYFVADETGDAAVIEYTGGKLNIYDNEVNAITNCPVYHWHLSNQRNYIGLKAFNQPTVTIGNKTFGQFGQGSGAIGLPGDFTPPLTVCPRGISGQCCL